MPLIDRTYFDLPAVKLVVDGNEDYIDACIESFEPEYLRAVMGESLYAAFMTGISTPTGVYFSNGFSDAFFKGTIADRWKWIRDGHSFFYCSRQYNWPGMQNTAKRSPIANYVYWKYFDSPIPSPTGSFTVPKTENATVVSPYRQCMRAWNWMVDQNDVLYKMLIGLTDVDGALLYPEFVRGELRNTESNDVYHRQGLF